MYNKLLRDGFERKKIDFREVSFVGLKLAALPLEPPPIASFSQQIVLLYRCVCSRNYAEWRSSCFPDRNQHNYTHVRLLADIETTNATSKTQGAVDEWSKTQLKGEKKVNSDIHCLPSPLHYGPGVCTANGVQQVLFLCDKSSISPAPFPDFGYYLYLRSTTACHNLH